MDLALARVNVCTFKILKQFVRISNSSKYGTGFTLESTPKIRGQIVQFLK